MNRRVFLGKSLVAGISAACHHGLPRTGYAQDLTSALNYKLDLKSPAKLFDGKESYCHPRAGIVPGLGKHGDPRVVMTLNTIALSGSDVFKNMYGLSTDDLGKTWTEVRIESELGARVETIDGVKRPVACSDFWPTWHMHAKKLLGTGHTVAYTPEWKVVGNRPRDTSYAVYDATTGAWNSWRKLPMPEGDRFRFCGAGCTQRYDLANGDILLPTYYRPPGAKTSHATVMRCSFDGETLKYLEHGDDLVIDDGTRGAGEPSITFFDGMYYLTIRHPKRAYAARSKDGLHYEELKPWTFDDGGELGSYETQQHWVTHSDGLFLVYTRRGANNDHVFRHRAPLFMAQVDPERMVVMRETEKALVPNRGARLGNFGVTNVSRSETWVTVAEWMQPKGVEKYGSDGSVWVAKILWDRPNQSF